MMFIIIEIGHGVRVIVVGHRHGDTISNLVQGCFKFHLAQIPLEKYGSDYFTTNKRRMLGQTGLFNLGMASDVEEKKIWIPSC